MFYVFDVLLCSVSVENDFMSVAAVSDLSILTFSYAIGMGYIYFLV